MKERLLVSCNSRLVDIQAIFISQPDSSERWQSDFSVLFVFDKEIYTSLRVHVNGNLKLVLCSGEAGNEAHSKVLGANGILEVGALFA
jgi:hypothetical protein